METLTHFKKLTNPDYLGVYALDNGQDLIATIASIGVETITGANGKKEDCTVMHFREAIKPMITNITNLKMMAKLFKTPYVEKWIGRRIQIYADYNVRFGGETVEGLRIRPTLPVPEKPICNKCNANIQAAGKLNALQVAEHTQRTYGMPLCAKCATAEKAAREAATAVDVLGAAEQPTTDSTVLGQADEPVNETNIESENVIDENN
jgi:ribosomal protein L34E